jgi:hypothetical protein
MVSTQFLLMSIGLKYLIDFMDSGMYPHVTRLLPSASTRRILNLEDVLDSTDSAVLQVGQTLLNTFQSTRHNLLRLRLEPTLLKTPSQVPAVHIPKVLERLVHIANISGGQVHALRETWVLLAGQHKSHSALRIEHLGKVLDGALLGDGVESVQQLLAVERFFEAFHDGFVAVAVVDDRVAFAAVDEFLDVRLGAAGDGDDGVDVGFHGELQGVGADGGGGAVDYKGRLGAFCCWEPGLGEAEAGVEAQCCGQSGEGNGGAL